MRRVRVPETVGVEAPRTGLGQCQVQQRVGPNSLGTDKNETGLAFQSEMWGGDGLKAETGSGCWGAGPHLIEDSNPNPEGHGTLAL